MGLMLSLIFRNWELILLILSQPPWEKKADLPKVMCWDTVDPVCHTGALLPPLSGRQQAGAEEHDGKIFLFSDHLLRGSTSGSDRVSKPTPGPLPHHWWRIKELGEKSQTEESAWKRCFYVHLHGKKRIKVYSMKVYVSQKIHPHEPVCWIAVIIQALPNGNYKIRVGCGERATTGKVVIMCYFFSSFRSLGV